MNKKVLNFSILIITFTSIFYACSKNDEVISNIDFTNPKEDIGKLHNEDLQYILTNVSEIPKKGEVKPYVEKLLNQKYNRGLKSIVSLESIPDFPENIEDLDLNTWLKEFNLSSALKLEISRTFELIQSEPDLNVLIAEIETRELEANNLFEGAELELYYEHLAVAKYTSIFWYPEKQGGLNGIQYLDIQNLKSSSNLKSIQAVNWWKVLGVDCIGGMMGGPVGYVGASGIAVIMQL